MLYGLGNVPVVVEDLDTDATNIGLTKQNLQTDVELRLRQSGVKVGPNRDFVYLYLSVIVMKGPGDVYAIGLDLELNQPVTLVRDPKIDPGLAPTWSLSRLSLVNRTQVRGYAHQSVRDLVDQFLNAYLEQNPKLRPAEGSRKQP